MESSVRCSECRADVAPRDAWLCGCTACKMVLCSGCALRTRRSHSLLQLPDFAAQKARSFGKIKQNMEGSVRRLGQTLDDLRAKAFHLSARWPLDSLRSLGPLADALAPQLRLLQSSVDTLQLPAAISFGPSTAEAALRQNLADLKRLKAALVDAHKLIDDARRSLEAIDASVARLTQSSAPSLLSAPATATAPIVLSPSTTLPSQPSSQPPLPATPSPKSADKRPRSIGGVKEEPDEATPRKRPHTDPISRANAESSGDVHARPATSPPPPVLSPVTPATSPDSQPSSGLSPTTPAKLPAEQPPLASLDPSTVGMGSELSQDGSQDNSSADIGSAIAVSPSLSGWEKDRASDLLRTPASSAKSPVISVSTSLRRTPVTLELGKGPSGALAELLATTSRAKPQASSTPLPVASLPLPGLSRASTASTAPSQGRPKTTPSPAALAPAYASQSQAAQSQAYMASLLYQTQAARSSAALQSILANSTGLQRRMGSAFPQMAGGLPPGQGFPFPGPFGQSFGPPGGGPSGKDAQSLAAQQSFSMAQLAALGQAFPQPQHFAQPHQPQHFPVSQPSDLHDRRNFL